MTLPTLCRRIGMRSPSFRSLYYGFHVPSHNLYESIFWVPFQGRYLIYPVSRKVSHASFSDFFRLVQTRSTDWDHVWNVWNSWKSCLPFLAKIDGLESDSGPNDPNVFAPKIVLKCTSIIQYQAHVLLRISYFHIGGFISYMLYRQGHKRFKPKYLEYLPLTYKS